jgi:ribosomal protein S12 methylthiotransferase accessory factor
MKGLNSSLRCFPQLAPYLIDERVGIIHQLKETRGEAGSPNFFHFFSELANSASFSQRSAIFRAYGSAANRETAAARAISQSLANYCAALYELERYPLSTAASASFPHIEPEEFALYSSEQYQQPGFPWVVFDRETPIRWAPAFDPLANEIVDLPAALVFCPYDYVQGSGDAPIVQSTLAGLACRCDPFAAALAGLCKVIEDDALALVWQSRLSVPHIRIETLSDENYELVSRFERGGYDVTLLNITTDLGVTTILAVLHGESCNMPALVFASAADPDPECAVRFSLENLARVHYLCRQITANVPRLETDPQHENILSQIDHLNFWCDHENASQADFIFSSKERIEFDEIGTTVSDDPVLKLEYLLGKVREAGYRALLADITSADIRELGLTAVRGIIPGCHPLYIGHNMRALGGKRLWQISAKLGYRPIDETSGDNQLPHPFLREDL